MEQESPREQFLSSQEILSTIEWVDVLQDHQAALEAISLFETHMGTLLQALQNIQAKKFSRFLKDAVLIITRPIRALHRIREFVIADPTTEVARRVQQDQHTFLPFEERISSSVCELVSNVVGRWQGHQSFVLTLSPELDNELNNQHYLLVYLILLLLDRWVAPEEMEAASSYFEYANPKYKKFSPRGPNQAPTPMKDTGATLRHLKNMMDLCIKCHLSIEDLLVWKPTPGIDDDDDSYDEEALVEDNYPLSEAGITTLLSAMILAMTNPAQLSSTFTLPMTLAQDWFFTTAGGLASGFLTNDESQLAMADKALSVLLYSVDRTPLNGFKSQALDYCALDSSMDRMSLFQIFQVMVTFAATCSSASHRFFCFQGLDRLLQACEDDVKMYLLEQLISPQCPFESMRAAAINLLKATVERSFSKLDKDRAEAMEKIRTDQVDESVVSQIKSPFTSQLLLKTFLPSVWRFDVKAFQHSPLKHEGAWHEKYDTFMHALNFYLFLLMRDKKDDNLTEIWSTSNIKETDEEFLEPLSERVQELKEDYIQRLARVEMVQDAEFGDDNEPPLHRIKSKNGVVNFDIDMDSGDETDDDDEIGDGQMNGNSRPKDTVLGLNQDMMKLELMDELLERIHELTGSVEEEQDEDK
ncbi:hypothetical protein BGZ50_003287 [Haplosporangium sp. Z 11]|nr:hypothetical protein BGZ50_003287 [Haplosporangium sp. Z 11]